MKQETDLKYLILPGYKPVYEVPYKKVYLDEKNRSLLSIWNDKSELINNETYMGDCLQILSMIIRYSVTGFISDVTMNRFIVPPESLSWYAEEIAPKFGTAGLKKCALIVESDLTMIGSLEEIANRASKLSPKAFIPEVRFFNALREAHDWAIR